MWQNKNIDGLLYLWLHVYAHTKLTLTCTTGALTPLYNDALIELYCLSMILNTNRSTSKSDNKTSQASYSISGPLGLISKVIGSIPCTMRSVLYE